MLVVHRFGFCSSVKSTNDTVGTETTWAKQSPAEGCWMVTESPLPGTPIGLQLRWSDHDWLSAIGVTVFPTQV